ncbi:MAG: hypothetical protein HOF49_04215 [Nitrosomonadales bacterium]|nr:hypothetical protein [Nitrosomonadales bacterium]MBT4183037.1 hypothetical protein [Nitrosomonadales bacterium]MBT4571210.1 hypothetical protein [Nitrosomonadales bacterium]MBT4758846.1 hypothetical protein [Nitrosomonadales bacterium]MBT5149865.1 hypothetical protein [Nitrosomonadales bacterium]
MKNKKTISKVSQSFNKASGPKLKNQVNPEVKEKKKTSHNNFYRALEAFSDCV